MNTPQVTPKAIAHYVCSQEKMGSIKNPFYVNGEITDEQIMQACKFLFYRPHIRNNEIDGLRLSNQGVTYLSSFFSIFKVKVSDDFILTNELIKEIHQKLKSPWGYSNYVFSLLDDEVALIAQLTQGDISRTLKMM